MTYVHVNQQLFKLYGISGSKGHGKDTFAKLVLAYNPKFKVLHFADDLKRCASRIFGIEAEHFNDPALKESPLLVALQLDLFLVAMRVETGLPIEPAGCTARTPREVLQYFGTEYVRRASPNYWVDRTLQDIGKSRLVLVPDTRFLNEAEGVRAKGGFIIEIVRIDVPQNTDSHTSETERATLKPDLIVGVRTGDMDLPKRVANLIAKGKFKSALRYDYRTALEAIKVYQAGSSLEESSRLLGDNGKDPYCLKNILNYYGVPIRKNCPLRRRHAVVDQVVKKQCSKCAEWYPLSSFNASVKSWDGLHTLCRGCCSQYNHDKYQRYEATGTLTVLLKKTAQSAKHRGLFFDLTLDQAQSLWEGQEGKCYYSGLELTLAPGKPNKVTFDRKDSSQGYTLGNVVLCAYMVNIMKHNMSIKEFGELVQTLADRVHLWRC